MIFPRDFARGKKRVFLQAYSLCGIVKLAAKAAGVTPNTHYGWMQDPSYCEQFRKAQDAYSEILEEAARQRAVKGIRKYKFHKGEPIMDPRDPSKPYYEIEYSDALLALLLKGAKPEKYRERVDLSGAVANKNLEPKDMTDEQLLALIEQCQGVLSEGNAGGQPGASE